MDANDMTGIIGRVITAAVLFVPAVATAQVVITEIGAYEKTDHEWVEIFNAGPGPIDLTGWKFWENATNHGLNQLRGDFILDAGEYAIIAQKGDVFLADRPGVGVTVIDSSWSSLKEAGEEIGLKDASGNFIERFTYLAAPDTALERRNALIADYTPANWLPHPTGGTPGQPNVASLTATPPPATVTETPPSSATNDPPVAASPPPPPDPPPPPPPRYSRQLVINEFLADPLAGNDEWVELYNAGTLPAKLDGWKLMEGAGAKRALSGQLAAGGFLVVLPNGNLNNDGDHLLVLDDGNVVVTEISYGNWDDGNVRDNAPIADSGSAVARRQDGVLTADLVQTTTPTPGAPNRITAPAPPPPPTPDTTDKTDATNRTLPTPQPTTALTTPRPPALTVAPTVTPLPSVATAPSPSPSRPRRASTATLTPSPARGPQRREKPAPRAPTPNATVTTAGKILGSKRIATVAAAQTAPQETALTVVGTVLATPGTLGRQIFYLADDTGGIQIYQYASDFPDLQLGDTVEISGVISSSRGEPRLKTSGADGIRVVAAGAPPTATPRLIAEVAPRDLGTLVSVTGEVTAAADRELTFDDGSGEITVALRAQTMTSPDVGSRGTINGIVVPDGESYQLKTRNAADLRLQPPPNVAPASSPIAAVPTPYVVATGIAAVSLAGAAGIARWKRHRGLPPPAP